MNTRRRTLLVSLALALLAGCEPPAPAGNLAGADVGGAFTLIDQDGQTMSDKDFAGRYRLMYFGYSFCPDICPTDVQKMVQAMKRFEASDPASAAKVVPVFVTIDPARDTPAALKSFVAAFHPRLTGLTGSAEQVAAALKTFRVYAAKQGGGPDYLMDHSANLYLFGPDGAAIQFWARDASAEDVAADLRKHVT